MAIRIACGHTPWAMAAQPSLANPQVSADLVERRKEITLGFFFDELFAVGRFAGDEFLGARDRAKQAEECRRS